MADVHHHGHGPVVEQTTGPGGVLAALAIAALVGFLVWLFAFSGIVFDRGDDGGGTIINNEQQQEQPQQPYQPGQS